MNSSEIYSRCMVQLDGNVVEGTQGYVVGGILLGGFTFFIVSALYYLISSEAPCVPSNVNDPFYALPLSGMCGQRVKHRLVLVRHGESEHNKKCKVVLKESENEPGKVVTESGTIEDINVDSELTTVGHEQARQVAQYLESIRLIPDEVVVSPMKRTQQTAYPTLRLYSDLFRMNSVKLTYSPAWMEINMWKDSSVGYRDSQQNNRLAATSSKETFRGFVSRIGQLVDSIAEGAKDLKKPKQTVVFTHSMVISEFLNAIVCKNRDNISEEDWSNIYWQCCNGSVTCIDLTENDDGRTEWHVHAVNYMRHLTLTTGIKTPFV